MRRNSLPGESIHARLARGEVDARVETAPERA